MTSRFIVCPNDPALFRRLSGRNIAVELEGLDDLNRFLQPVDGCDFTVHYLMVDAGIELGEIEMREEWKNRPLALRVPGIGRMKDLLVRLPALRELNVRVYLPSDRREAISGARILSSLGIETAVEFSGSGTRWDDLIDLATYAFFNKIPHAPIEPFHHLGSTYSPTHRNEFGGVYGEDPDRYLHVDREGHVALSRRALANAEYLETRIEDLGDVESYPLYHETKERWKQYFIEFNPCSTCAGWRVCLGKFDDISSDEPGCRTFFSELIDLVEQYGTLKDVKKPIWQP